MNKSIYTIGIELVRGCNFKCRMCLVTANSPEIQYMELPLLQRIVDETKTLRELKTVWLFNLGEPLLHPQFRRCLEIAYESEPMRNALVIVHTNGSKLYGDVADAILEIPLIKKLVFSFDGFGDKESYSLLRGNSYDTVIKNISQFAARAKLERPDLMLSTCTILPKEGEVEGLAFVSAEEAVSRLTALFEPMGVSVETREMHNYSGSDNLEISGGRDKTVFGGCSFVEENALFFNVEGFALPCCNVIDNGFSIGSINDSSFEDLVNSEQLRRVQHYLRLDRRDEIEHCKNCALSIGGYAGPEYASAFWKTKIRENHVEDKKELEYIHGSILLKLNEMQVEDLIAASADLVKSQMLSHIACINKQAEETGARLTAHISHTTVLISDIESRLTGQIAQTNEKLAETEGRLTGQISQINEKLAETEGRLTGQIAQTNEKLAEAGSWLSGQISQLNHITLDLEERLRNVDNYTANQLNKIETSLLTNVGQTRIHLEQLDVKLADIQNRQMAALASKINNFQASFDQKIADLEQRRIVEHIGLAAITLDLLKSQESGGALIDRLRLFRKNRNMFNSLRSLYTRFTDGIILKCSGFRMSSILTLSKTVPFNGYMEHFVEGYGTQINFFIIATLGSKLFAEVVANGDIVKQEIIHVDREGHYQITTGDIAGKAYIRFKALDNSSIVRILEVASRKYRLFTQKSIAAYID